MRATHLPSWTGACAATVRSEIVEGARDDAFHTLVTCDVVPEGGVEPPLSRIRGVPNVDLQLGALRYGLRTFREEIVRTRVTLDSLVVPLDRALAGTR